MQNRITKIIDLKIKCFDQFKNALQTSRFEEKPAANVATPTCPSLLFNVTSLTQNSFENPLPPSPYTHLFVIDETISDENWLKEVNRSLVHPNSFTMIPTGISASYLIKNEQGKAIAIYKPNDQAGGAINNPKQGMNLAISLSYEATLREWGAHLVSAGVCDVPELHRVKLIINGKIEEGSLQKFVENDGTYVELLSEVTKAGLKEMGIDSKQQVDANEVILSLMFNEERLWRLSKAGYAEKLHISKQIGTEVHKIGVLDLIIQNNDRVNPQNILFKRENDAIKLTPIDHNLAFPEQISPFMPNVIWMQTVASSLPFDSKILNYIDTLDLDKISKQLLEAGMSPSRLKSFKCMGLLVKMGAKAGLSLHEIGAMAVVKMNSAYQATSEMKEIVDSATTLTADPHNETAFFNNLKQLLRRAIMEKKDQIARQGYSNFAKTIAGLLKEENIHDFNVWKKNMQEFQEALLQKQQPEKCAPENKILEVRYGMNGTCEILN
jgi:Phosphatidylinositol 3- and 4-kinase